jgi:hypothetical protein
MPHLGHPPVADLQVRNYIEKQAALQGRTMIASIKCGIFAGVT